MGIDESLIPRVDGIVLNLSDVGKSSTSIGASEVLQGRRMVVVFSLKLSLDFGQSAFQVNGGFGSRDTGCSEVVLSVPSGVCGQGVYLLGLTKEEPKVTTLLSLNATLATALAKGMPFYM